MHRHSFFFFFLDTVSFGTGLVLQSDVNSFKGGGSTYFK